MTPGDTAPEAVGDIEKGGVAIGDARVERENLGRYGARRNRLMEASEKADGSAGPHRPMAEQAAAKADGHRLAVAHDGERRHEVEDDVVVIAGIERDALLGARRDDAAEYIERAIAV